MHETYFLYILCHPHCTNNIAEESDGYWSVSVLENCAEKKREVAFHKAPEGK